MSDDELDQEWKPNGRPQSTMARSFSAALNDVFKIDNSLADLDAAVEQKKRAVSSQSQELEALEGRLRATEERLRSRQVSGQSGRSSGPSSPRQRVPLGDTFAAQGQTGDKSQTGTQVAESNSKAPARPATAKRQEVSYSTPPMPGGLPPTPGASDDGEAPPPPPHAAT